MPQASTFRHTKDDHKDVFPDLTDLTVWFELSKPASLNAAHIAAMFGRHTVLKATAFV